MAKVPASVYLAATVLLIPLQVDSVTAQTRLAVKLDNIPQMGKTRDDPKNKIAPELMAALIANGKF